MSLLSVLAARRNPNSKGILKRYQETVELMHWKYSDPQYSLEDELKTVVSMPQLVHLSRCSFDKMQVPWTCEDKDLIAEKCRNKTFEETFEIEKENLEISKCQNEYPVLSLHMDELEVEAMSVDEESSIDEDDLGEEYCQMFLQSALSLGGNKMKPLFENKQTNFILAELIGREKNVAHKIRGNAIRAHSMFPPVKSKTWVH